MLIIDRFIFKRTLLILTIGITIVSCGYMVRISPNSVEKRIISADSLYVDFQGGFKNDTISLFYGENNLVLNNISTHPALGLAEELIIKNELKGLTVILCNDYGNDTLRIDEFKTNFVGVWYDGDKGLKYYFNKEPFIYE